MWCSHQAARQCMFLHSCTNGHLNGGAHTCFMPLYKFGVDFHVFPGDPSPSDLHNTSSGFVPLEVKTLQLMLKFFLLCLGLFSPFKRLSPSESAILQLDGWSDSQSFHLHRSTSARPRSPPARSGSGSAELLEAGMGEAGRVTRWRVVTYLVHFLFVFFNGSTLRSKPSSCLARTAHLAARRAAASWRSVCVE